MLLHSQLMDELTEWQALCNGDVSYKYRCMDIRSQSQRDLIQHWETELKKLSVNKRHSMYPYTGTLPMMQSLWYRWFRIYAKNVLLHGAKSEYAVNNWRKVLYYTQIIWRYNQDRHIGRRCVLYDADGERYIIPMNDDFYIMDGGKTKLCVTYTIQRKLVYVLISSDYTNVLTDWRKLPSELSDHSKQLIKTVMMIGDVR